MKTSVDRAGAHRDRERPPAEDQLHPVARARFRVLARARPAADRQRREQRQRDQQERRGVREQGVLRAGARRRRARRSAGRRGSRSERADSTSPFAPPSERGPASSGTSANSAACPSGRADAEQRTSARASPAVEPRLNASAADDAAWNSAGRDRDRPRLEAIDQQIPTCPARSATGDQSAISSNETPTPCQPSFARKREREDGDPVADRRDGDRRGDDAQVTGADRHGRDLRR